MLKWLNKLLPASGKAGHTNMACMSGENPPCNTDQLDKSAAYIKRGNEFLAQNKLKEAAGCYRQAVSINPGCAEAFLNLGFVLKEQKLYEEAEAHLKQAVQLNPRLEDAYYLLGTIAQEQENLGSAIENFNKALELKPDFEIIYRDLCRALFQSGQYENAKKVINTGLSLNPDFADFHYYLGNLFLEEKEPAKAVACYQKALSIQPDYVQVLCNLGVIFKDQGDLNQAITCFHKALLTQPDNVDALNNLGLALQELGNIVEAMACYHKALELQPEYLPAIKNLGSMLQKLGKIEEAISFYRKALELHPDSAEVNNNLGIVFNEAGQFSEAVSCFRKALALKPDFSDANYNLGIMFQEQQKLEQALTCYRRALESSPDFHQARINMLHIMQLECDWKDLASGSKIVRHAVQETLPAAESTIPPFYFLALPGTTPLEQKFCATKCVQSEFQFQKSSREQMGFVFKRKPKPKIHVGYLSADFRNHPVAQLMAEVFELHDRDRFQITAYSYGPDDGSAMRKRLKNAFDHFVDLHDSTDEHMARKIHDDQTDILVDLTGYTHSSRSRILALRPAPVQVNYLGYPGTMGADFVDYLIADKFIVPPERQEFYTEKLAWLPDCYMPRDRTCRRLAPPSRKDCGLPDDGIVFCSFNRSYKITPSMFDIWCRLLIALPDSVLWLSASSHNAESNLAREAESRGVDSKRLIFAPRLESNDEHLARLQCADMFLDTLPYNAHTTCSDALWMGLPVITCAGDTFSSRVAGSLLTAIGVPELITYNLNDYYKLALELASNSMKREKVREKINTNRNSAPLFDSERFTRNLEAIYIKMREEFTESSQKK